jgi:diaminopimelate epimerase
VAAAAAALSREPDPDRPATYRVDVPGGSVEVELSDQAYLTGPAVIVARGVLMIND